MIGGGPPPPIVPTPAAIVPQLRGRRVLVGVPGVGWRGDLRADDPVVHGSRSFVPVLSEQDFYRAETEQMEVFAPLVPINRVWVEHAPAAGQPLTDQAATITLDAPPRRDPLPAALADRLTGQRVVQVVQDGHVRDLRAVTEVYQNDAGIASVRVCGEAEWYRWAMNGTTPTITELAAELVWAE